MRRLLATTVGVCLLAWAPDARDRQDPPAQQAQQPPVFRAGVDVVQLEVFVLDADRRPVRGLKKEDFEVEEDGQTQPVVGVDEIVLSREEAPPPVWARAVLPDTATNDLSDRRLVAIVMDDLNCCALPASAQSSASDMWAIENAVATAIRLLDELRPRDLATIAFTHDPIPAEPFTNDYQRLRNEIRRFQPITEGGCRPRRPTNTIGQLSDLLAVSPQPLKAIVVLMSLQRIDPRVVPICPDPTYTVPDTGIVNNIILPPDRGRAYDRTGLPKVPVYRLNVSGLPAGSARLPWNGPNQTGGRDFLTTNDLAPIVREVMDETTSYYLLGFRTSRPTVDGKYRRLSIRVKGHGDYEVRTRDGYFRPSPPGTRKADEDLAPVPHATRGLLPNWDITLEASAAAFPNPDGPGAKLAIVTDIRHQATDGTPDTEETLDLRTVAYLAGDARETQRERVTVPLTPGFTQVATTIRSAMTVEPGRYELWTTARDPKVSRTGGVFYDVDVPDFTAQTVVISGVVLGSSPREDVPTAAPFDGWLPITPTVSRRFSSSEAVSAFFQVVQGRSGEPVPVDLTVTILDAAGATAVARPQVLAAERFAVRRTADVLMPLPLEDLPSGDYLLSIEARVGARLSPKRDIIFHVR